MGNWQTPDGIVGHITPGISRARYEHRIDAVVIREDITMNKVQNDRQEWVVAVGAPGSIERVKIERPEMINSIIGS